MVSRNGFFAMIGLASGIFLLLQFQNCSNANFSATPPMTQTNSSLDATTTNSFAPGLKFVLVLNSADTSSAGLHDQFTARVDFNQVYSKPRGCLTTLEMRQKCLDPSQFQDLGAVANSQFLMNGGATVGWLDRDVASTIQSMFSTGASSQVFVFFFLSEKTPQPLEIGRVTIFSQSSNQSKTTCPNSPYVVDPWPYSNATQVWFRAYESQGLAMLLTRTQLLNFGGSGFSTGGDAGGGTGALSLCPGDLNGQFPAARYLKSGTPCISSRLNIYYSQDLAQAAVNALSSRPELQQLADHICFLIPAEAYYINTRPSNFQNVPQWWINTFF